MIRSKDERLGLRQMQQQQQQQQQKRNPLIREKATATTFLPRLRRRVAKKQLTEPSWL